MDDVYVGTVRSTVETKGIVSIDDQAIGVLHEKYPTSPETAGIAVRSYVAGKSVPIHVNEEMAKDVLKKIQL